MSGGARVAVTPQNDVIVAGAFCGTLDVGDGPIASQGSNTSNGFIVKLQGKDGSGKTSDGGWLTTFGDGSNSQGISDVAVALTGEIVVGGEFKGSLDQGGGSVVWNKRFEGSPQPVGVLGAVAVNKANEPIMAGGTDIPIDFGTGLMTPLSNSNGFLVKLSP